MDKKRDVLLTHLLAKEYNSLQFTNNNDSFPSPLNIQSKTAFMRILLPSYTEKSPSNTKLSSSTLLFFSFNGKIMQFPFKTQFYSWE